MKREDAFEQLEPPPGGLTRLRAAMAERPPRRWLRWALASELAVVSLLALAQLGRIAWPPSDLGRQFRAALPEHHSREPVALRGDDESTALLRVPTENPKVVFYWVASTE